MSIVEVLQRTDIYFNLFYRSLKVHKHKFKRNKIIIFKLNAIDIISNLF